MEYAIRKLLLVSTLALGIHYTAAAQYTGPSAEQTTSITVSSILENPVENQKITLSGHILRHESGDNYIFSDGTAEILVEIDKKDLPTQSFNEKTLVEIYGEVDTKPMHKQVEIDVERLRVIS